MFFASEPRFSKHARQRELPPSVNYHINTHCNFACKFCFATFEDSKEELGGCMLKKEEQFALIDALVAAGVEKLTFVGGEPTLIPWLPELVARAKASGLTTMIVTNGWRLQGQLFEALAPHLDWIAFSVDSADEETNRQSGRAQKKGGVLPAAEVLRRAEMARARGIRIKLNTVVHRLNCEEDMSEFVAALRPERWKLFQVLPVEGQNDGSVDELLIEREEFEAYVARHEHLESCGVDVVPESNDAMRGSYAMVDPAGRFFDNTDGGHTYSRPILEVGVDSAFRDVSFCGVKFEARGGVYDWADDGTKVALSSFIAISGVSGAGKDTVAQFLIDELGYERLAIADPIKEHVGDIFGLTKRQLWGDLRNEVIDELGVSPRKIYQDFGRFCREIDAGIWLRALLSRVRELIGEGRRVVCTDVRTHKEFEAVRSAGASLWHITRSGAGAPGDLANDSTERQARELAGRRFDVVIENNGPLEELQERVLEAARDHGRNSPNRSR